MYTITLQDAAADIPEKTRLEAERRFQRTLYIQPASENRVR